MPWWLESERFITTEDLRYTPDGDVIIPKGTVVEENDDFPTYILESVENPDKYSMSIHMGAINEKFKDEPWKGVPWYGKLKPIE